MNRPVRGTEPEGSGAVLAGHFTHAFSITYEPERDGTEPALIRPSSGATKRSGAGG